MQYFETTHVNRFGTVLLLLISIALLISNYLIPMTLFSVIAPIFAIFWILGLLHSNFVTQWLSLFPHLGGLASAVMGATMASVSGVTLVLISLWSDKIQGEFALSWVYTILAAPDAATYWLILDKPKLNK